MLSRDEQVVMHLRTHIKSLIGVILILFLASALLGIGLALIPEQYKPWTTWVLLGLYLIAIIWFVLKPWLLWLSATYTVTIVASLPGRVSSTRPATISRCAASTTSTTRAHSWTASSDAEP